MNRKTGLAPLVHLDTRILVLGTLPGERSLAAQQYYANRGNRFWKIVADLAGKDLPQAYALRTELLKELGIGLWDVLAAAHRPGSMDKDINQPEPNDLQGLCSSLPALQRIVLNGKEAERLLNRFHPTLAQQYPTMPLPSSSGANTHLRYPQLLALWQEGLLR